MLAATLAKVIRDKVQDATKGRSGTKLESRFIFHGPPLELLRLVYEELAVQGGIQVSGSGEDGHTVTIPVLLQLPTSSASGPNPGIGESGICDESHLLHIRNDPNCPSFVALVPPGQHNNRSVASTTEEFGISPTTNSGHVTFDQWWEDGFVQELFSRGLRASGLADGLLGEAQQLVRDAASAIDEVDEGKVVRKAAWRLLSRLYSVRTALESGVAATPGALVSLACGVPPMGDGGLSARSQISLLGQVADVMADGFKTGVGKLKTDATPEACIALDEFLSHVQAACEVPTMFERATEAFYLPGDGLELSAPPNWWSILTTECWSELLSEEPDALAGDLVIECVNSLLPVQKGLPAIVKEEVRLAISTTSEAAEVTEVQLTGGSFGKTPQLVQIEEGGPLVDTPAGMQKSPATYKVAAAGHKASTLKVISLATWVPGLVVTSRLARKLTPPRKPKRAHSGNEWETFLSLPGSGRYELLILVSPGIKLICAEGVPDSATEVDEAKKELAIHETKTDEHLVEVEADGKYQLDITFKADGRDSPETCRVFISCEEVKEEGCRSEFERLIKLNRRHLEKLDSKAVIQLDRNARASSLQSWMLDEQNVSHSFRPVVIAEDYASCWATPNWEDPASTGPILSKARFLHDPRPNATLFSPPPGFVEARRKIAERIRETDDQSGLVESAPLGLWLSRDDTFRELVEAYLESYMAWLAADRDIACWADVLAVCPVEADGRTLSRVPEAIMLSPLHPLRLAWHCLAQHVMHSEIEGPDSRPCPAVSILDPDCIPDVLTLSIQAPGGIDKTHFLSVECNSDYWSVLWNGSLLRQLAERTRRPPFDNTFGVKVGGISSGFSPAQVARALEDVSDLLAAKPVISLVVSSAGGTTDACNEGLASWCSRRFGSGENSALVQGVGPRVLEIFDTRPASSRPDQAAIANLSEDTGNKVRWFDKQPSGTRPDLGIIAQLDSAQPESTEVGIRSPLGIGGLLRHRVRRQLHGAFLSESRQAALPQPFGETLADKVSACIVALEGGGQDGKIGLQFAPSVHSVSSMLEESKAGFVAVSSTAIDPACFLAGWIRGTYLWDYDLPSYSHRAGDTSGYYLLSQVKDADREALRRILVQLPGCESLTSEQGEQILLEVARRGIPTVRGLSGDDTGATGDLGLFLAVRLLQDQFRTKENIDSLLPVLGGSADDATVALIIPVDPFRGYLADLARSLSKDKKDASLSRPDLLVVGIQLTNGKARIHLTPIEVKCRQGSTFSAADALDALSQATTLSSLFSSLEERASKSLAWRLAYQHLLLSMIGFGLRVYSQHHLASGQGSRWAAYHEQIATAILDPDCFASVDEAGRLIVIDASPQSAPHDRDGDGFAETIVISGKDAGRIVSGDAKVFYDVVRAHVGTWRLLPSSDPAGENTNVSGGRPDPDYSPPVEAPTTSPEENSPLEANQPGNATPVHDTTESVAAPEKGNMHPEGVTTDHGGSKGIIVSVGQTVDGFEPRALTLNVSDTRLNQLNIGVVGDLGTGKTQFLKSLILQISASTASNRGIKPRFLIFDYKRDYSSSDFVEATGARVVKPTQLPLNLFDTSGMGESAAPWLDRFRFFADVLDKVYSGIGPVQRDKLKGAVKNAYESCRALGRQPTIYDIHHEYRELLAGKSDSPMAIIDDLVDMEIFAREPGSTRPFDKFLDGVVVVSLDALGQDDRSKNMLVAIMLNMFYENMLKTPKRPFEGSDPQLRAIDSYLLVDEADNIMRYEFEILRKLLLQGREFGAGVILASQYLRHFKVGATDYREPLLTWFIHKVPNATPSELGALGFTSDLGELSDRVKTLPNHHCLYKSFDIAGEVIRGLPFYELAKRYP